MHDFQSGGEYLYRSKMFLHSLGQKQSFVQNGYGTEKKEDRDKKGGSSGKYIRPL